MIAGKLLGYKMNKGNKKDGTPFAFTEVYLDAGTFSKNDLADGARIFIVKAADGDNMAEELFTAACQFKIGDKVIIDANEYNGFFGKSKYFELDSRKS